MRFDIFYNGRVILKAQTRGQALDFVEGYIVPGGFNGRVFVQVAMHRWHSGDNVVEIKPLTQR